MSIAKKVELIGSSTESWEHAVQAAVNEAIKTIRAVRERSHRYDRQVW